MDTYEIRAYRSIRQYWNHKYEVVHENLPELDVALKEARWYVDGTPDYPIVEIYDGSGSIRITRKGLHDADIVDGRLDPWKVVDLDAPVTDFTITDHNLVVAKVTYIDDREEQQFNAKLIAQAPALLGALESILLPLRANYPTVMADEIEAAEKVIKAVRDGDIE